MNDHMFQVQDNKVRVIQSKNKDRNGVKIKDIALRVDDDPNLVRSLGSARNVPSSATLV